MVRKLFVKQCSVKDIVPLYESGHNSFDLCATMTNQLITRLHIMDSHDKLKGQDGVPLSQAKMQANIYGDVAGDFFKSLLEP